MGSFWLSLGLLFLGILCTRSSPISNGNGTWIFLPLDKRSFTLPSKNQYSVQPWDINEPQNLESPIRQLYSKQESDVVSCGLYTLGPGQTVTIRSRNYKGRFTRNKDYRWTFKGTSDDSKITISCSVYTVKTCMQSSLLLTSGSLPERFCKKWSKITKTSDNNRMKIYFRSSDRRIKSENFACSVSASVPPTPMMVNSTQTSSTTSTPTSTTTSTPTSTTTSTSTEPPCEPCGTVNRVTRIVGGVETEVNEYPWQVAIVYAGTNNVFCGGTLLNDGSVITAAQCVQMLSEVTSAEVLVGAHDLDNPTEVQQRINLARAGYFASYNPTTLDNDLGIIWLSTPVIFSERVKPVCLPDATKDYNSYEAVTSGWGSVSEGGSQTSTLNEVEVPVLTNDACNVHYPSRITSNMICSGYQEGIKDRCQGDTGGPLVVEDNGLWVLAGITSWGDGCGRPNSPGVYSRVSQYISELVSVLEGYGDNRLCY